jgi:uncharacterized protein YggT (Ycf19 family)
MPIAAAIMIPIISVIIWLLKTYKWIIIISIVMRWVGADPNNRIVCIIHSIANPALDWARRWFGWLRFGILDFSPIAIFVLIIILTRLLLLLAGVFV